MICPSCGLKVGSYRLGVGCFRCAKEDDPRTKEQLLAKLKIAQRELQVMKSTNRAAWKRISEGDVQMVGLLKRWLVYGEGTGCESVTLLEQTRLVIK